MLDHDFISHYTQGFEAYRDAMAALDWADVEEATGLTRKQIRKVAELMAASKGNIVCWAMGLTQHKHSVAMLRDVVNLLLLRGDIGKPGAGLCPVRGHSNVQGDRTMGIWEQMPAAFHDKLDAEFSFSSPREHGVDTVGAIRGMRDGTIKVFVGMGGNFAKATPDTAATEAAMRSLRLTVQVSTKLNRSHIVTGRRALILPTLGRTEKDVQATGPQMVTVEDSMSMVHESQGSLKPASRHLRSEVAIVAGLAERVLRDRADTAKVDWRGLAGDYRRIRTHIEHVVPGFDAYEEKLGMPGGFVLPHGPRDHRTFATDTGKAKFTVERARVPEGARGAADPADAARPRPVQHHDLRQGRPVPRHPRRPQGGAREREGPRGARPRRRRPRRPRVGGARRIGAAGGGLAHGRLQHPGRMRGGLLPRDERARAARLRGGHEQHARPRRASPSAWSAPPSPSPA